MEDGGRMSYVKKVIHSLVVSCPERMTIERLMHDYRSEEGCNVPYGSLGFRDTESFLRSIPDTVVVVGHGPMANVLAVSTANSAHIQNLVQCQKKPSKNRNRGKLKPKFFFGSEQSDLCFINESIRNMKLQQQRLQQQLQQRLQQRRYQQPVHSTPVSYPNYSRLQQPPRPAPVVYPNINALISAGQQQQVLYNHQQLWFFPAPMMLIPFPYPYPQNVQRPQLPPTFPKIIPILPPRQNPPRPGVQNFQSPQPHVAPKFQAPPSYPPPPPLIPASVPRKEEAEVKELTESFKKLSTGVTAPNGYIDPLDNEVYVSDGDGWVKDDSSSEDGKPISTAAKEEEDWVEDDEDWIEDNFSSEEGKVSLSAAKKEEPELEAVELELETVSYREPTPEPENTVQPRRHTNPFFESSDEEKPQPLSKPSMPQGATNPFLNYESSDDGSDDNAIPAYAVDDRVLSVDYPKDCVRYDFKLPVRDTAAAFAIGERIEVQLVRVENPHSFNFWVYNEEYDDYKAMYLNMQVCYANPFVEKYNMPLCLITTNHLCVVRSLKNGAWERAQVLRHQPGEESKSVEVQLVDTGEVMCVSHKDVKHLVKDFATLPPQCVKGRLAFVTPWKGPGWSAEAIKYFVRLVSFRRLYARIEAIKDNYAYLVLVDPDSVSPLNMNLNKALIDSGWVRRCYTT